MEHLNEKQRVAYDLAVTGHNVLVTGQCGTGKSHLLRCIIQTLKRTGKKVSVTSTTGMASLVLGQKATTLHHWSGLGDGRFTEEELSQIYNTDDRFCEARKRVQDTDVLVIDEVGMLSELMFLKLELVCRLGRGNDIYFGGLQIIVSGDFKQLPPVPNYRYGDTGNYCFQCPDYNRVLPHRINLTEVVRQDEAELIRAVNQLCDGNPDQQTEDFLRSLSRPLADDTGVLRLFGTNFDTAYVNQISLDAAPGREYTFKSKDEGKVDLLKSCGAEKMLSLKVGAPVILIRNLQSGMFNGSRGTVHSLEPNKAPVVNINGRLIVAEQCRFEIYDPSSKTVLAVRTQYPFKLAYGLTVHRAQGQTVKKLEIDCHSFFAPGQMGVAVGRAVRISGLRIVNYNSTAAHLKHPQVVYDFYQSPSAAALADLSCCRNVKEPDGANKPTVDPDENNAPTRSPSGQPPSNSSSKPSSYTNSIKSPWCLEDFFTSYNTSTFFPEKTSDSFISLLQTHSDFLYSKLKPMVLKKKRSNDDMAIIYTEVNEFLTSPEHQAACLSLIESPKPHKLSTKLFLWLLDNEFKKEAEVIVARDESRLNEESTSTSPTQLSAAASSKIRYLAGACLHKIISRLRTLVSRNLGKSSVQSKAQRDWGYKLHRLLKGLRISEDTAVRSTTIPESMFEIEFRQGPTRGLLHVSDPVFIFFSHVHIYLQTFLSAKAFHLFDNGIHLICRQKMLTNDSLKQEWGRLFAPASPAEDNDTFDCMTDELYSLVVEHFLRISIAESLHSFKAQIPKTKKQALRSKVTALGERDSKKKKLSTDEEPSIVGYFCPICKSECLDSPALTEDNSICCDACNRWCHFKCVKLHGNENFLKRHVSTWKCPGCRNAKGRGKKLDSGWWEAQMHLTEESSFVE